MSADEVDIRKVSAAAAVERAARCRDWLKTLMLAGAPKSATKDELFAWAIENLGVNRSNFDTGWVWAIWDMKREDGYVPSPRKQKRKHRELKDHTHRRYRPEGVINGGAVNEEERAKNRTKSKVRTKGEHPFLIIKRVFGFTKVGYRGLKKNTNSLFVACRLCNLCNRIRRDQVHGCNH